MAMKVVRQARLELSGGSTPDQLRPPPLKQVPTSPILFMALWLQHLLTLCTLHFEPVVVANGGTPSRLLLTHVSTIIIKKGRASHQQFAHSEIGAATEKYMHEYSYNSLGKCTGGAYL